MPLSSCNFATPIVAEKHMALKSVLKGLGARKLKLHILGHKNNSSRSKGNSGFVL